MFVWQIILLVIVAVLAVIALTLPLQGALQKILRFLLAWVTPYSFITVALCALFMQGWPVALVFFAAAFSSYLIFLRRLPK